MATVGTYADIGLGGFIRYGGNDYCYQTVDGPNSEVADDHEVTNSCSVEKEYIAGIIDGGVLTLTINFDPDHPVRPNRTVRMLEYFFPAKEPSPPYGPNRAVYRTMAYVKSAPISADVNSPMTQTASFKITGIEEFFDTFGNLVT